MPALSNICWSDKNIFSLFCQKVKENKKSFIKLIPGKINKNKLNLVIFKTILINLSSQFSKAPLRTGHNFRKKFTAVSYEFCNKLDCLLLASLSRLVYCSWARSGSTLERSTWKVFHLGRLLPYPIILYCPRKACKGKTL